MTMNDLICGYHHGGGSLSGDTLSRAAGEVWTMMLSESRGRIAAAEDEGPESRMIQQAFNSMVAFAAAHNGGDVQSETLGQWSRTYRDSGKSRERQLVSILRQCLGETGLLYRGWPA